MKAEILSFSRIVFMPPITTKHLRINHSPFVSKELSKAIMLRCKLRNQYLKCNPMKLEVVLRFRETFLSPYLEGLNMIITIRKLRIR